MREKSIKKREEYCQGEADELTWALLEVGLIQDKNRKTISMLIRHRLELAYAHGGIAEIQESLDELISDSSDRDKIKPTKGD